MSKISDLTGQRFAYLVALRFVDKKNRNQRWLFRCDCGNEKVIVAYNVVRGDTLSCGCWRRKSLGAKLRTHGMTKTKTFGTWTRMISRCSNPKDPAYPNYGGRGIKVCDAIAG